MRYRDLVRDVRAWINREPAVDVTALAAAVKETEKQMARAPVRFTVGDGAVWRGGTSSRVITVTGDGGGVWMATGTASSGLFVSDIWGASANSGSWGTSSRSTWPYWFAPDHPDVAEKHFDDDGRLHRADGPAIVFTQTIGTRQPETHRHYFWHGLKIDNEWIIEEPDTITVWTIKREQNAEIRRVMIERYLGKTPDDGLEGASRYIRDCGATEIDRDAVGILWRKEFQDDEPLMMVEVLNSTVEPHGSKKRYFLRVDPQKRTARQAIAWTFGMKAKDYYPEIET